MCQVCEAGEMFAHYFERDRKCRWRREDLKPRFGAKSPMGCHHGYGLENLRFVTLCLVNWLCRWLSMFLSRLRGKRVFTSAE